MTETSTEAPAKALDGKPATTAKKLRAHWDEARKAERSQRKKAKESRAFYGGKQWTPQQLEALKAQGRAPIVINRIFKAVNNLLGKERDSRLDWKVLPRGESDVQAADAMTKALAYVADASKAKFAFSAAFKDAVLGPCGWVEVGLRAEKGVDEAFVEHVPAEDLWCDPHAQKLDLSDARYMVRTKWVDLDLALAAFPEHAEKIRQAVKEDEDRKADEPWNDGDDYGNRSDRISLLDETRDGDVTNAERDRVQLREHHWWETESADYLVTNDGRSYLFEEAIQRPDITAILAAGAQRRSGERRCYYRAIMVGPTVLEESKNPYPWERSSFVRVLAYLDDEGHPFGVVEMMKDPQREVNTSRSRLNESLRSRWLIRGKDAAPDLSDQEMAQRLGRANFSLTVNNPGGIQLGSDKADVPAWANLMQAAGQEVDDVAGQNEAAYGDKSNEKSGKAIQARVAQQGLNMAELFDNLRFARLLVGEMLLALMQRFYSPQRLARIVEASVMRQGQPVDVSWLQGAGYANPIEQLEFDVVIEDQAENATERQAAMEQMIQLIGLLPDPAKAALAPFAIRSSDFADKDEMAAAAERAMLPPPGMGLPGAPVPEMPPGAMPPMVG